MRSGTLRYSTPDPTRSLLSVTSRPCASPLTGSTASSPPTGIATILAGFSHSYVCEAKRGRNRQDRVPHSRLDLASWTCTLTARYRAGSRPDPRLTKSSVRYRPTPRLPRSRRRAACSRSMQKDTRWPVARFGSAARFLG